MFAPCSTRKATISTWLFSLALIRGVQPSLSWKSRLAPCSTREVATLTCPFSLADIKAHALTAAPFSSKQLTTSACPSAAEIPRGVNPSKKPSLHLLSTFGLCFRRTFTKSRSPFITATINGMDLIESPLKRLGFKTWTVSVSNAEFISLAFICWRISPRKTASPDSKASCTLSTGSSFNNREDSPSAAILISCVDPGWWTDKFQALQLPQIL